ncbi:MAG: FixH family protein [Magnetococcales bacterium]|nr:FixH family protein [Magnetococcales bacterium]
MNHSNISEPARRSWRPEPWLTAIILFFLLIFAVNALMIRLSLQSWTGEVTDEAYRKGLAFNQTLQAQQEQDALGWQISLENSPLMAGRTTTLQVTVKNDKKQPLTGAVVHGTLYRPSSKKADMPVQFTEVSSGLYTVTVTPNLPGSWELRLTIKQATGQFRYVHRLQVAAAQGDP